MQRSQPARIATDHQHRTAGFQQGADHALAHGTGTTEDQNFGRQYPIHGTFPPKSG